MDTHWNYVAKVVLMKTQQTLIVLMQMGRFVTNIKISFLELKSKSSFLPYLKTDSAYLANKDSLPWKSIVSLVVVQCDLYKSEKRWSDQTIMQALAIQYLDRLSINRTHSDFLK